jgi:molybdate transport system ATP-binding protein
MSSEIIARVHQLSAAYGAQEVLSDISFEINLDQCLAVVGPMGSGKTTLAKALSGRLFRKGKVWFKGSFVLYVAQQHHFKNRSNISEFYLQQRFNSADSEDSYTVREELGELDVADWIEVFGIEGLMDKPLLQLSNGENKRLQIVKALGLKPNWLLLDNPYLGLDVEGRSVLSEGLRRIHAKGIRFILFLSGGDVPDFVNLVYQLRGDIPVIPRLKPGVTNDAYSFRHQPGDENNNPINTKQQLLAAIPYVLRGKNILLFLRRRFDENQGARTILRKANHQIPTTIRRIRAKRANPRSLENDSRKNRRT